MKSVTNTPEASSSEPSSGQQSNGGKTPEHDFCLLDQSNRRNIFLAEILRGITKTSLNNRTGPKIVKKILALAVKEIDMLIEACASKLALLKSEKSDSLQMVSSELQDLKKIKGHVELIKKTLMKHHRQGKNVARVILGVDPIPPKHSSDGMFPVVPKYGSLPTVPVKKQSKQAKEAEIIKSKKTKHGRLRSIEIPGGSKGEPRDEKSAPTAVYEDENGVRRGSGKYCVPDGLYNVMKAHHPDLLLIPSSEEKEDESTAAFVDTGIYLTCTNDYFLLY